MPDTSLHDRKRRPQKPPEARAATACRAGREPVARKALEKPAYRNTAFEPRQAEPGTLVNAKTKRQMPVVLARQVQPVGPLKAGRVAVGSAYAQGEHIMNLLARNEVDLVIMGRAPDTIACTATAFATNPLGIVSAPEHPMSRRRHASPSILKDQDFVVRESGSGTRQSMERLFAEHHINPPIVMEMPSNESIKQAVMAGMGLSFLSLRTVRHELASGHLVQLDIEGLPIVRHWYVTHLQSKRLSPVALALKSFLIEEAGALVNLWA